MITTTSSMSGGPLSRRSVLTGALALPGALLIPSTADAATKAGRTAQVTHGARASQLAVRGADLSFTLQLERAHVRFRTTHGVPARADRVLAEAGANWERIRVWVNPPSGYSTLSHAIVLARRAKRLGMKVLLDLHYSDFWADPAHQATPAAWAGQDLTQLADTVRRYTKDALETMSEAGVPVQMVQIGNEITAGMLWPLGKIYGGPTENWDGFTTLLKAGIAGARQARTRGPRPRIMVHIDRGGDNGGSRYFYDHIVEHGVRFDLIGQSYYPFWHGPISDLQANLVDLAGRYDKGLIVVETAYPWTLTNGDGLENLISSADQLPDGSTWPASPAGQLAYFRALRSVFAEVPGGRGLGFMWWEPEWLPGVGWEPGEANPNDNLTVFDFSGRPLPALAAFAPRLAAVRP